MGWTNDVPELNLVSFFRWFAFPPRVATLPTNAVLHYTSLLGRLAEPFLSACPGSHQDIIIHRRVLTVQFSCLLNMSMAISLSSTGTRLANKNLTSIFQRPSLNYTTSTVSCFSTSTSGSQNLIMFSPSRSIIAAASAISGSPEVGEDSASMLDTVQVFDLNNNGIPVSDLWKDRKAVVAFARHFGCVLCRKRADYLATKKDRMDAAGVALVLIGPGSVEQARAFSEQTKFKGEVYADPNHGSYEALRFVSGVSVTFTSKAALKIMQSYMEGYRQDWGLSFEKDTVRKGGWQQGGVIVAGPGKSNISYIHKDKEAGDDPDIEDVLKACCS